MGRRAGRDPLRPDEDDLDGYGRTRGDYLERGVSGFRTLLGIHTAAVPPLSGADEREDRVGSEIRPAEFSVRTSGAGTGQSQRLQCRVAQMGSGGCQSARAWYNRRGSAKAV